jgi:hypothetical protein
MELDELKTVWLQHEKTLVEQTRVNFELLRRILISNTEKSINWLKIRTLASLILPVVLIIFIAVPRVTYPFTGEVIAGLMLFGSLAVITYAWTLRYYLLVEKLDLNEPITSVSRQVKMLIKYKLKIKHYGLAMAPFAVIGIFLSAGIPFLSVKMIPFYALMGIVFLVSTYLRSKHGSIVQLKKINQDLEEIAKLEQKDR